jgi:hypothetical protein
MSHDGNRRLRAANRGRGERRTDPRDPFEASRLERSHICHGKYLDCETPAAASTAFRL